MILLAQWFKWCWIGICALSLVAQTRILLDISLDFQWVDGYVFGGTVFGYHFYHRVWPARILAWVMGLVAGICLGMATLNDWGARLMLLAPVLGWVAYYGVRGLGLKGLRGHLLAKPIIISTVWAGVTVLLPVSASFWPKLAILFLGRASFIFALALAYDLGDLERDRARGFSTLAEHQGFNRTFGLIYWSLALSALCVSTNMTLGVCGLAYSAGLMFSLLISAWWLRFLLQKKTWAGWHKPLIDGLMVLQLGLVLLFGGTEAG